MRVAFHSINGVGLGHLVRTTCLAREMRAIDPAIEILVLTNAGDTSMLDDAGLDFVKLPPRSNEPHADPDRARTALPGPLEAATLEAAFRAFAPDLVVFDTHAPMAIVRTLQARCVLVLREVRPEVARAFVKDSSAFDRILVPHEPGELELPFPATFTGPIVRPLPSDSPSSKRTRIVALSGGGGQPVDARRYVQAVADAHVLARTRIARLETTLVIGPYGLAPSHAHAIPGLTIARAPRALPQLLAGATLVISQAGYNAVAELRLLAKPAILVPGRRKAEDQKVRARRLARTGAAVLARPEARSIADHIEVILLDPERLGAMRAAHQSAPIVPRNREAAEAALRCLRRSPGPLRKVVLVAHDYFPKLGGMETVARGLVTSLRARGLEVRVFTTNRLGAAAANVVPLYQPLPPPRRIDLTRDLLATIAEAQHDPPDVIHLCHAGLAPWVPALRAALPCVVTVGIHGNDLLAPWVEPGTLPDYDAARIAGLSAAHAVFAVSSFSRALAIERGVQPEVVFTVENGIDAARFAGDRRRTFFDPGDEVVLTVSRLAPRKGHRAALRALAMLRRPRLVYAFTGASETMRAELVTLARDLGVRVLPLGFVPDETLPALYRSADVFVLLAESDAEDVEGFGVALLEAAASGLPIVAAHSGGIPEAVGDAGVLVPPGDPAAAAHAIASFLDDPQAARALGERARVRSLSFTSDRVAARFIDTWGRSLDAVLTAGSDVSLLRESRAHAARSRDERDRRVETLRAAVARGSEIRLRATGDGARRLPDALADCAAIGHRPRVVVKLRKWLESDFVTHALPHVSGIDLVHGVPHPSPAALLAAVHAAPEAARAAVRSLRLFLTPGADPVTAVTEARALRRLFADAGAVVLPPPELMRWLSDVPAGGPTTGMIEPTNMGNLARPTCPTGTGKIAPLPQMTLPRFEHVLREVPALRNLALWNDGEPLLNRELPGMIAHAKKRGVSIVKVSSNVHLLDTARGQALLVSSVDGASQAMYEPFRRDGSLERVAMSVAWQCAEKRRLGRAKPRVELLIIAMHHNEHELPEMRRLARERGVAAIRVKTVGAEGAASKGLVPASRLLSRYAEDGETPNVRHSFCTMAWDHTVVNVDGSVTPCCYLRPDMGEAFVMGNVFDTPWNEIWRGERYRAFRASMLGGHEDMPVCNRCRGGTHDLLATVEEVQP